MFRAPKPARCTGMFFCFFVCGLMAAVVVRMLSRKFKRASGLRMLG